MGRTWPQASVNTVFGRFPLRPLTRFRSRGRVCNPRCSLLLSSMQASITFLGQCIEEPVRTFNAILLACARRNGSRAASWFSSEHGAQLSSKVDSHQSVPRDVDLPPAELCSAVRSVAPFLRRCLGCPPNAKEIPSLGGGPHWCARAGLLVRGLL